MKKKLRIAVAACPNGPPTPPQNAAAAAPLVDAVTKRMSVCVCVCVSRENQVNQNERIIRSAQKKEEKKIYTPARVPLTKESASMVCGTKRNETGRNGTARDIPFAINN